LIKSLRTDSCKIIFSVGKAKTQEKQKLILLPFLTDVAVASVAVVPVVVAVVVVATCCFCWRVCNQNAHFPEKRSQKNKKNWKEEQQGGMEMEEVDNKAGQIDILTD